MIRLVAPLLFLVVALCGCIAITDEAVGIWENKSLPLREQMEIRADGTYIISDMKGDEESRGDWINTGGLYIFTRENGSEKQYAGLVRGGRGQVFLIFENVTYLKI